jgi:nucleoside-diphosphate-sugar epimerase
MDFEATWIKPSIASVLSILRSAATHAPTVKSIVITGSIVAVTSGLPDEIANVTFTNESWNPITPALAQASGNHMAAYASSKKEAELVIWDFVKTASPHFTVTVLLPTLVLGPPIQHIPALKNINATVGLVYTLINGTYEELPNTHTFLVPNYIDVRDLATAHVRALTEPAVANKRLVIGRMGLTTTLIVDTLRALAEKPEAEGGIPALKGRLPVDKGGDAGALTMKIDAEEGNEALKLTFRSTEETFGDMAKKLLELEKELGGKYERGIL